MTSPGSQPEDEADEIDEDGHGDGPGWENPVTVAGLRTPTPTSSEEEEEKCEVFGDGKGAVKIEPKEERPKTPQSLLTDAVPTQYPCDTTRVCYQWSAGFGVCGDLTGDPAYHVCVNGRPHGCALCGQPHREKQCDADEQTKRKRRSGATT